MSILIKGMEMPTGCYDCDFFEPYSESIGYCGILSSQIPCDCPLVPVPPHGRLIDADAFKMMLDEEIARLLEKGTEYLDYRVDTLFSDFKQYVDKMPTIIPAEEAET